MSENCFEKFEGFFIKIKQHQLDVVHLTVKDSIFHFFIDTKFNQPDYLGVFLLKSNYTDKENLDYLYDKMQKNLKYMYDLTNEFSKNFKNINYLKNEKIQNLLESNKNDYIEIVKKLNFIYNDFIGNLTANSFINKIKLSLR